MSQNHMRKLVVSEWVSLDGVFDDSTMDQWFYPYESDDRGEQIKEGVLAADAFLLGRVTYEMLAPYWSSQKNNEFGIADRLNSAPKYVVSSTLQKAEWDPSIIIKHNLVEEVTKLKQQPGQDILTFGSATLVQSLMKADLIDEYRFLVHPVIMGSGKRFFRDDMDMTKLKLVKSKPLSLDVTLLCYQPANK
jgi:dihydrofolate reductase